VVDDVDVSRLNLKTNYVYTGLIDCDLLNPIRKKYNGQGTATSKIGEKITLTKVILKEALSKAKTQIKT
jgi:hypothetical protein